ncbi:MAG: transcription termination/antitermination protein NusG [Aestuariivirga sp.]
MLMRAARMDCDSRFRLACEAEQRLVAAASRERADHARHARWFVATCRFGDELAIAGDLAARRIEAWCPKGEERRPPKRGRPAVTIERPVFHSYVFVRLLAHPEAWIGALAASRLRGYLSVSGRPEPVAERLMDALMLDVKRPEIRTFAPRVKAGMSGTLREGRSPFGHFQATVRRVLTGRKEGRLAVEIDVFGRATLAEIGIDDIEFHV